MWNRIGRLRYVTVRSVMIPWNCNGFVCGYRTSTSCIVRYRSSEAAPKINMLEKEDNKMCKHFNFRLYGYDPIVLLGAKYY